MEGLAALAGILLGYNLLGWRSADAVTSPPWALALDAWIPFTPHVVWVYLGFYFSAFVLVGLHVRAERTFRATLLALVLVSACAWPVFAVWPAAYPRPQVDPALSLSHTGVLLLQRFDPPTNTLPSLHVANSVICAAALRAEGARCWRGVAVMAICIAASVLLLKQHWVADVLAGLGWGSLGVAVLHARLRSPAR